MPYRDPRRPLVRYWFSASDAETVEEFNHLISPKNVDTLVTQGGFTIVATHFGKGFAKNGQVDPVFRRRLTALAERPGWFPTVGELLDWLLQRRGGQALPRWEWTRMQLAWVFDLALRKAMVHLRKSRIPLLPRAADVQENT
jgi:hypothetical protein